ncbi:MAG: hypothetical protein R2720_14430 [Candidatus Nanopelagicales bacterium]
MTVLLAATVLLFVVVGVILGMVGEFGKGADAVKSVVTLLVLSAVSGYVVALASGSM